jgi:protein-S-isoprenylcysteine O-methyltransferase Ste14
VAGKTPQCWKSPEQLSEIFGAAKFVSITVTCLTLGLRHSHILIGRVWESWLVSPYSLAGLGFKVGRYWNWSKNQADKYSNKNESF